MALSNRELGKTICIACNELFTDHSKRELIRCMFRIQGTMVSNGINNSELSEGDFLSEGDIADAQREGHVQ